MRTAIRTISILALVLSCFTVPAAAQYLYMDANGNGVHDAGDRMKKKGPTTVDFYLNSNHNRDGSLAMCINPDPPRWTTLHVTSFGLALQAVGGTVSWGTLTETPEHFELFFSLVSNATEHHVFYGLGFAQPRLEPGLHHLGRMQVSVLSGQPALQFAPELERADGFKETTSFGTPCPGLLYDSTYDLGAEFQDADGLAASGESGRPLAATGLTAGRILFDTVRPGSVRVDLYDVHGRRVRVVFEGALPAGRHDLGVERGQGGSHLAPGVYFYRITGTEGVRSGRVALTR